MSLIIFLIVDWQEEWSHTVKELKSEAVKAALQKINQRLEALDEVGQLSPEQEKEQSQLLEQIVKLRSSGG